MSDKGFSVRFREGLDDDLREATRGLNKGEKSRLARDGFRLMLGFRTTRAFEVKEQFIQIPQLEVTNTEKPLLNETRNGADNRMQPVKKQLSIPMINLPKN